MIQSTLCDYNCIISNIITKSTNTPVNYIVFEDPVVKNICIANWGSNGELTRTQAETVTDLGTVFQNNAEITSFNELEYFTGLTEISILAFISCINLTSIVIPSSVVTIKGGAFNSCTNLKNITIPNSVLSLDNGGTFGACAELESITLPNSIINMGDYTFNSCSKLQIVNIPSSITSIGSGLFSGCSVLHSITIPGSVNSINNNAFENCILLDSITIETINPPILGIDIFLNDVNLTNIYVPMESVDTYKTATKWSDYADKISAII